MNAESSGSLQDNDAQVRKLTSDKHGDVLRLIEDLLVCCLRGFTCLGSFTLADDNRLGYAHFLLATRGFNALHCANELLQQGYYTQALTLVRSAMEDNLTALDCEKCKEALAALLEGTGKLGKGRLTYAEMAKRQGEGFRRAWTHDYGALSEYAAHARKNSLKTLVDPDTHTLRLGGLYDCALFIVTCGALLGAAIGTADVLAKVLGTNTLPWQQECWPKLKAAADWRERVAHKVRAGEEV